MAEPVIRVEHVSRTYHVGDIDVHALRDYQPYRRARRVHRHHGRFRIGQVDADVDPRLPRPARRAVTTGSMASTWRSLPSRISPVSAAKGWVSYSRASICCRAPVPSKNVALPLLYAMSGQGHARARFERAREVLDKLGLRDRQAQHTGPAVGRAAAAGRDRESVDQSAEPSIWRMNRPAISTRATRTRSCRYSVRSIANKASRSSWSPTSRTSRPTRIAS